MAMAMATAAARAVCGKSLELWASLQVERQGRYSLERLGELQDYCSSTTATRTCAVVALSPLLCLVTNVLMDCYPLQPPSAGLAHSHLFFVRAFFLTGMTNVSVLMQFRQTSVLLLITNKHILCIASLCAATTIPLAVALAHFIGYPLPFTIVLCSPAACITQAVSFMVMWGDAIRSNADVRCELVTYIKLITKMISLTYVYPIFIYVFNHLSSRGQTAFALLLPVLKFAAKNSIAASAPLIEDLRPETITLNIDIFHSLFVMYSMQSATSMHTVAVLISLDVLSSVFALRR